MDSQHTHGRTELLGTGGWGRGLRGGGLGAGAEGRRKAEGVREPRGPRMKRGDMGGGEWSSCKGG